MATSKGTTIELNARDAYWHRDRSRNRQAVQALSSDGRAYISDATPITTLTSPRRISSFDEMTDFRTLARAELVYEEPVPADDPFYWQRILEHAGVKTRSPIKLPKRRARNAGKGSEHVKETEQASASVLSASPPFFHPNPGPRSSSLTFRYSPRTATNQQSDQADQGLDVGPSHSAQDNPDPAENGPSLNVSDGVYEAEERFVRTRRRFTPAITSRVITPQTPQKYRDPSPEKHTPFHVSPSPSPRRVGCEEPSWSQYGATSPLSSSLLEAWRDRLRISSSSNANNPFESNDRQREHRNHPDPRQRPASRRAIPLPGNTSEQTIRQVSTSNEVVEQSDQPPSRAISPYLDRLQVNYTRAVPHSIDTANLRRSDHRMFDEYVQRSGMSTTEVLRGRDSRPRHIFPPIAPHTISVPRTFRLQNNREQSEEEDPVRPEESASSRSVHRSYGSVPVEDGAAPLSTDLLNLDESQQSTRDGALDGLPYPEPRQSLPDFLHERTARLGSLVVPAPRNTSIVGDAQYPGPPPSVTIRGVRRRGAGISAVPPLAPRDVSRRNPAETLSVARVRHENRSHGVDHQNSLRMPVREMHVEVGQRSSPQMREEHREVADTFDGAVEASQPVRPALPHDLQAEGRSSLRRRQRAQGTVGHPYISNVSSRTSRPRPRPILTIVTDRLDEYARGRPARRPSPASNPPSFVTAQHSIASGASSRVPSGAVRGRRVNDSDQGWADRMLRDFPRSPDRSRDAENRRESPEYGDENEADSADKSYFSQEGTLRTRTLRE